MKTDPYSNPTVFPQIVSRAVAQLKKQLRRDYEQAYPDLREIIHLVLDEEEANAWSLTAFPHLVLPDLIEAHIATINLRPAETKHANVFQTDRLDDHESAFALCA